MQQQKMPKHRLFVALEMDSRTRNGVNTTPYHNGGQTLNRYPNALSTSRTSTVCVHFSGLQFSCPPPEMIDRRERPSSHDTRSAFVAGNFQPGKI